MKEKILGPITRSGKMREIIGGRGRLVYLVCTQLHIGIIKTWQDGLEKGFPANEGWRGLVMNRYSHSDGILPT